VERGVKREEWRVKRREKREEGREEWGVKMPLFQQPPFTKCTGRLCRKKLLWC
jgi:hypothetical protein